MKTSFENKIKNKYIANTRNIIFRALVLTSVLLILQGCARSTVNLNENNRTNTERLTTTTSKTKTSTSRITNFPNSITGLNNPVAIAFAPDGRIFITERIGRIRVVTNGRLLKKPYLSVSVPKIAGYHETGLLGIALHPNFKAQPYVYFYQTYSKQGNLFNKVVRVRDQKGIAKKQEVILDNIPGGRIHNGGIIAFGNDGNLYITTGETGSPQLAQNLRSFAGKILRIKPDGKIPKDNPFPNSPVFSLGHRNVFGIAFSPSFSTPFITENGPNSDDEINQILPGKNYGWPVVLGISQDSRFVNPIKVYRSIIAPTQAIFYRGNRFRNYKNWFIFGTFTANDVRALRILDGNNARVSEEKTIYKYNEPVVGISQSPDGYIYVIGLRTIRKITKLEN